MYLLVSSHPYFLVSCLYHMPLFACLHPHIRRFVCACSCSGILTSSYLQVHKCWLVYSQPCISYPQIHVCLLVSLHPHILRSSGSSVLVGILASSHPRILRFMCAYWYPHIHLSLGSCVFVGILASSHLRILRFMCAC